MFSFFCFENYFQIVNGDVIQKITWGSGNYREKAVLLWDLENIPYSHLPKVKQSLKFAPERSFIISTQTINLSKLKSMNREGFEVLRAHKSDSDSKIKSVYRILKEYDEFIFISSDSDFVDIGKKILSERKKLTWIMQDANKKRIAMKMNQCDKNLKLITLSRFEL